MFLSSLNSHSFSFYSFTLFLPLILCPFARFTFFFIFLSGCFFYFFLSLLSFFYTSYSFTIFLIFSFYHSLSRRQWLPRLFLPKHIFLPSELSIRLVNDSDAIKSLLLLPSFLFRFFVFSFLIIPTHLMALIQTVTKGVLTPTSSPERRMLSKQEREGTCWADIINYLFQYINLLLRTSFV